MLLGRDGLVVKSASLVSYTAIQYILTHFAMQASVLIPSPIPLQKRRPYVFFLLTQNSLQ
jgi:hypothetical protein